MRELSKHTVQGEEFLDPVARTALFSSATMHERLTGHMATKQKTLADGMAAS